MLRAAVFDLDNTLILRRPSVPTLLVDMGAGMDDAERAYAESEAWQGAQILKENQTGERMDDALYAENIARIYARALGGRMDAALTIAAGRDLAVQQDLAPGTIDALSTLKDMGLKLGVASNNQTTVRRVLNKLGLAPFFEYIAISEELNVLKPDPRILEIACAGMGVSCSQAVYVGDHPFDILCAHDADMRIIWLPPNPYFRIPDGVAAPDFHAKSIAEVPEIIQQMMK